MNLKQILLLTLCVSLFNCETDNNETTEEQNNQELNQEFSINEEKFSLNKAVAYSEAESTNPYFYYFDITLISENISYTFPTGNEQANSYSGSGSIFEFTVLSESKTYIADGDYLVPNEDDGIDEPNEIWDTPFLITNFTFDETDIYDLNEDDYFDFKNLSLNFKRNGEVYTITGTGTLENDEEFKISYEGSLVFDPDSEI